MNKKIYPFLDYLHKILKTDEIKISNVLLFAKLADVTPGEKGKSFGSTTEAEL